ncbi:MAG: AAA family ATPase [bacterium]|nr:AAA family ATPase [bacterium]
MDSAELLNLLAEWHANCDPDGPVVVGPDGRSEWYVPLDAWPDSESGETISLRGHPPAVPRLVKSIDYCSRQASGRSAQLFAGFRGTGKSTELGRVAHDLRQRHDFAVLEVRADEYHHLSGALTKEELALVLAAGIGEAAREMGAPVLKKKSIWQRIADFLLQEVEAQQLKVRWGPMELQGLLKAGDQFQAELSRLLGNKPDRLQQFLHDLVHEIAAFVRPGQLVVLVDGLDKFYAPAARTGEVYEKMADLFFHHTALLRLPSCHVVYTVPPYLAFLNPGIGDRYEGSIHILPSVRVHGPPPERTPHPPGLRALEEVLARRVDLDRLFGDARPVCVGELAAASGGHVRDLFRLAQDVLLTAESGLPVGPEAVRDAINQQSNSRGFLFRESHALLRRVASGRSLETLRRKQLGELANAMDQYLVLCFKNARPWYDVHPLVRSRIRMVNEVGKLS